MKKVIITALAIAIFLFASCSNKCPSCPADQNDILKIEFQNGMWPEPTYAGCEDTTLYNVSSTVNYGSGGDITCGQSGADTRRALIRFDITSLVPQDVKIVKAYLRLEQQGYTNSTINYRAYKVTKYWQENNATWEIWRTFSTQYWSLYGGDYTDIISDDVHAIADSQYVTFSLNTDYVQDWLTNPGVNNGIIIRPVIEDGTDSELFLTGSEYGVVSVRPKLTIYYRLL